MKHRVLPIVGILAVFIGWYNNRGPGTDAFDRLLYRALLPVRIARLVAEPPDESLLVPVAGVAADQIADTWLAPRGAREHHGQDIFAPRGTPVVAAAGGIVMRAGENALGGRTVSILGRGGRTYYYAHLDRYAAGLSAGDAVQPGTVVGYVGNTGNAASTPPHLHFGVYDRSGPMDPLPLLMTAMRESAGGL